MEWLTEAARRRGGRIPTEADLELWAYLQVRHRLVAEYLLWEDREAVLESFTELLPALDGPSGEATQEPVPAPAAGQVDQSPKARFDRLQQWRVAHPDHEVGAIGDADLARIVSSNAMSTDDVTAVSARLTVGAVVAKYASQISAALRGADPDAPEPEPEPEPIPEPEPEPERAARTAPSPEPPSAEPDPFAPFVWDPIPLFAPYNWEQGPAQPVGQLAVEHSGDRLRFAWSPMPGEVVLYRIVESGSAWPSGAPELAGLLGVTRRTSGSLTKQPAGAVTYLAVWANSGATALEASQAQPTLVGISQVVWPPTDLSVQITAQRTVAALMTVPEGSRIEVQRFPKDAAIAYDINREIDRGFLSGSGFHDLTPPIGEDIVYAAFCVAELADGTSRVSAPATVDAHITPDVEQVAIQVKPSETPGAYDITWQQPAHGRVLLYATPQRIEKGLENEPRTREILEEQGGLTAQYRIAYPPEDLGGLMRIRGFVVDPTWVRAYFVAVHHVSDESMWVGPSVSMVTPRAPRYGQVVERVDSQVITFEWPKGVTIVEAYQGPRGQLIEAIDSQPIASLTEENYQRTGGMRVTRALPSNGCAVQLHGVVYLDGKPVYSEPATLDYPGVTRLSYTITPVGPDGSPVPPGALPAMYRIHAEVDDDLHQTPVALVGQLGRLPLFPEDGRTMKRELVSLQARVNTHVCDIPAGRTRVFLRLFIDLPPAQCGGIAVLDPGVDAMEVML